MIAFEMLNKILYYLVMHICVKLIPNTYYISYILRTDSNINNK